MTARNRATARRALIERASVAVLMNAATEDIAVPKLRVYVMHAGLPFLEGTIALLRRYREIYADLSQINHSYPRAQFHTYVQGLMQADLGKRLMYGLKHRNRAIGQPAWNAAARQRWRHHAAATR